MSTVRNAARLRAADAETESAARHGRDHRHHVPGKDHVTRLSKLFTDGEPALAERSAQGGVFAFEPGGKGLDVGDFRRKLELVAVPSEALAHGCKVEDGDPSRGRVHRIPWAG